MDTSGTTSYCDNIREQDTIDQMGAMVQGMAGKRLTYADLIADNDLDSKARA